MLNVKGVTDEMFAEELSLRQWINSALADRFLKDADTGLLIVEEGRNMNVTNKKEKERRRKFQ